MGTASSPQATLRPRLAHQPHSTGCLSIGSESSRRPKACRAGMRVCVHRKGGGQASAQLECADKSLTRAGRVPWVHACSPSASWLLHTLSPATTIKYSVTCHIPELWPGATQPFVLAKEGLGHTAAKNGCFSLPTPKSTC